MLYGKPYAIQQQEGIQQQQQQPADVLKTLLKVVSFVNVVVFFIFFN
jgi:hypothetical protein